MRMLGVCGIAILAVSLVAAPHVYAGTVTGGAAWYEFGFSSTGVPATGCSPDDPGGPVCTPSSSGNSVFADAPPWTITAVSVGATLTVTDAFSYGDAFDVFDFGVQIGSTSSVGASASGCGDDPVPCRADPLASSGVFPLPPGAHSITIVPNPSTGPSAAYFRLDTPDHFMSYKVKTT
jgi:hypothetical protein